MKKIKIRRFIAGLAAAVSAVFLLGTATTAYAESFSAENYKVLGNIIGAVESGGQVYGQKNYSAYAGAYTNSDKEVTCTLGWAQFYGSEARNLIQKIYNKDSSTFQKIDSQGLIQAKLNTDWVSTKWNPNDAEKAVLIQLISSSAGREAQDEMFTEVIRPIVQECESTYTTDAQAVAMYAEIRHLGGKSPAQRIFNRCNNNYSVDNILASLKEDQNDTSNDNQVGDAKFWSRHQKCAEWVKKYISGSSSGTSSSTVVGNQNVTETVSTVSLYRLYNKKSGEHIYTKNKVEVSYLEKQGWTYEGVAWKAPETSSSPVYRLYNDSTGEHFYTTSANERDYLDKNGWDYEGIGWYSDTNKGVAVYRELNPNAAKGAHNFTTNKGEHLYLVSNGWVNEGIAWYGCK